MRKREVILKRIRLDVWKVYEVGEDTQELNEEQAGKLMSELIDQGFSMHTRGRANAYRELVFTRG